MTDTTATAIEKSLQLVTCPSRWHHWPARDLVVERVADRGDGAGVAVVTGSAPDVAQELQALGLRARVLTATREVIGIPRRE